MSATLDLLVKRDDLRACQIERGPAASEIVLDAGQALLAIDHFALTANNITYAAFGDAMAYWQFFPAREGFGRVPVWGFADVARSRHDALRAGERVYGYFPMSSHLVVQADRVTEQSFVDAASHRAKLPPVYNQYTRLGAAHRRELEDATMLFRPLFVTSFLIDDLLGERAFFGAKQVVISSASSKTSLSLGFLLSRRDAPRCEVVGLTSAAHRAFAERTSCYDRVEPYEAIESLARTTAVFVDMAGNAQMLARVHRHLGEALQYSCLVGATHWEARGGGGALAGPKPELFFAPDRVRARVHDWSAAGFDARVDASWRPFVEVARGWISVSRHSGGEAVRAAYLDVLENRAAPERGYVLSLKE